MCRPICLVLVAVLPLASVAVAQSDPTKADREQQRKAAEKALTARTKEYDQARADARDRLGDDFQKYEAKRKELQTLRQFQRHLLDEVPWVFSRFTDGKHDRHEMLTFRQIQGWLAAATKDREAAINDDLKAKTKATEEQYKMAVTNFKELIIDPLVKAGPPAGSDTSYRTYDDLTAGIKQLEQQVAGYEKKLGDTAKRLADTQTAMDAATATLAEAEGRLTGKWKLDKVILYAEKKEQAGGSVEVWNKKTDIYWNTQVLTPTSFTNLGRKYLVTGTFTPPPALLDPGKPFDVTFQGSLSQSEKDIGWPGVLLQVLYAYVPEQADSKVKPEVYEGVNARFEGKIVEKVFWEVNPKRKTPTDTYTLLAPSAEKATLPVWRVVIRGWNTPEFSVVYQYKWLK